MAVAPAAPADDGRLVVVALRRKRTCDVVLGSVLALGALPIIATLAVASAMSLRAWPLFVQTRIGQGGRPFRLVKLRTLPIATSPWLLKTDRTWPRTPGLCRVLRRRHLDELPQLLLVPIGRMSLVGPRPKMPDDVEPVDAGYAHLRAQAPQGCTGLWQISAHAEDMPHETPEYDLFYLRNRSLSLDLWIIGRTALLMLGLAGPVTLADVPRWTVRPRTRSL